MTSSGIDPATFWFVVQCLNHCATACPLILLIFTLIYKIYHMTNDFRNSQVPVLKKKTDYLQLKMETSTSKGKNNLDN
jgi:hypothetical protein